MKRRYRENEEGLALYIAIVLLAVLGILATSSMNRVMNHSRGVENYVQQQETYQGAVSAYGMIFQDDDDDYNTPLNFEYTPGAGETIRDKMLEAMNAYYADEDNPLLSNPNVKMSGHKEKIDDVGGLYQLNATYAIAGHFRGDTMNGSSMIMEINRTAFGPGGDGSDNIWNSAIFASTGQVGKPINGNVSIHGTVHILGNDLAAGDTALYISGNSGIYNNYDGMPPALFDGISPYDPLDDPITGAKLKEINGELTLEAKLRVRNGLVSIGSGSTLIGQETGDADFGSADELTGVFVNSNWADTSQVDDGVPKEGLVNSENSYDQDYGDFSGNNNISFPLFADVIDEDTGQVFFDPADPADPADPDPDGQRSFYMEDQIAYAGDITIEATTSSPDAGASFYYNSSTGETVIGEAPGAGGMPIKDDLDSDEFVIWYDGLTSTLVVNGRVAVDGDISIISGNGGNHTINYEGQGSMLAYAGDTNPDGGHVVLSPNLYTTGFPVTNSIGIMAEVDFELGIKSQREVMGGFYSQGSISMDKQTVLAGTIVGTEFSMGGQVPDIYQVPKLKDSWVDIQHMIGVKPAPVGRQLGQSSGNIFFVFGVPL